MRQRRKKKWTNSRFVNSRYASEREYCVSTELAVVVMIRTWGGKDSVSCYAMKHSARYT